MITLNTKNGMLEFERVEIVANAHLAEVEKQIAKLKHEVEPTGPGWTRLVIDLESQILVLYFFNQNLTYIEVNSRDCSHQDEWEINYGPEPYKTKTYHCYKRLLEQLGGSHVYSWGAVELVFDIKGSGFSIIIRYKNDPDFEYFYS